MSDAISIIPAIGISTSGLTAESRRMEIIANNVANANTTKGPDGKVFRRKQAVFATKLADSILAGGHKDNLKGVELRAVIDDPRPAKRIHNPGHPEADVDGFVETPDVNIVEEMVDMMSANRAYEANLAAIKTARMMATKALEIGK